MKERDAILQADEEAIFDHLQVEYPATLYKHIVTVVDVVSRTWDSLRVSYQGSTVLKASASFSFDRYICGESSSLARDLKRAFNEIFNLGNNIRDGGSVADNENILNRNAFGFNSSNTGNTNSSANGVYGGSNDLSDNSRGRFSYPPGGTRII